MFQAEKVQNESGKNQITVNLNQIPDSWSTMVLSPAFIFVRKK